MTDDEKPPPPSTSPTLVGDGSFDSFALHTFADAIKTAVIEQGRSAEIVEHMKLEQLRVQASMQDQHGYRLSEWRHRRETTLRIVVVLLVTIAGAYLIGALFTQQLEDPLDALPTIGLFIGFFALLARQMWPKSEE